MKIVKLLAATATIVAPLYLNFPQSPTGHGDKKTIILKYGHPKNGRGC